MAGLPKCSDAMTNPRVTAGDARFLRTNPGLMFTRPGPFWKAAVGQFSKAPKALKEDAAVALAYVHYIYKLALSNRMPFTWQWKIEPRLTHEVGGVETDWWDRQADMNPAAPATPPPTPTRAPDTATATRIAAFIHAFQQATGVQILKKDIWVAAGYGSDKEFRAFQAEDPELSEAIVLNFNRILKLSPKDFIERRDTMRAKLAAKRKNKSNR